jgi:hypothetical protein
MADMQLKIPWKFVAEYSTPITFCTSVAEALVAESCGQQDAG